MFVQTLWIKIQIELGYLYIELKTLVNETKDNGRENTTFNMGCNVGNKPNLEEIDRNNNKELMDVIGLMETREELNLNIDCILIENKINHQVRMHTKKLHKINGSMSRIRMYQINYFHILIQHQM